MKCPIDTTVDLVMTDRQGIEIDYCPTCRGVWLDRGELDKLIERSAAALPQQAPQPIAQPTPAAPLPASDHRPDYRPDYRPDPRSDDRRPRWDDDDDDDDRHKYRDGYGYKKKKRSSILGEIFDF
jgi:Zn-finger nucleic acid-binding protein